MASRAIVLLLLLGLGAAVVRDYDPRQDFCRRYSHAAAVVGNRLYIDGGGVVLGSQRNHSFTNDNLVFHDLSTTKIGAKDIKIPPLMSNLSKPPDVPSLVGGTLWADQANGKLYPFGGEQTEGMPSNLVMWEYDIYYDKWNKKETDNNVPRPAFGASTVVEHTGRGYYFGGWIGPKTDRQRAKDGRKATSSLWMYEMTEDTWRKQASPEDSAGRAEGVMLYIPAGDEPGMLAHFGGIRAPSEKEDPQPAPMDTIDIYDMRSDKWHTQKATGEIPEDRRRFCAGVASAPDGSSHNIYLYGGMGFGGNITGFDDVYVLSIPSFIWVKVFPEKTASQADKQASPHYDLSCSVVGGAQMLVIGGIFPKDMENKNCDAPDAAGVHNLIMSKNTKAKKYWDDFDIKLNKYEVPSDILAVIGGEPQGGAKLKVPKRGFGSNDLETLFQRTVSPVTRIPTRTSPGTPGPTSSLSGGGDGPKKRRKVLLIVIPSVIGALILLALGGYFVRKRRSVAMEPQPAEMPGSTGYTRSSARGKVIGATRGPPPIIQTTRLSQQLDSTTSTTQPPSRAQSPVELPSGGLDAPPAARAWSPPPPSGSPPPFGSQFHEKFEQCSHAQYDQSPTGHYSPHAQCLGHGYPHPATTPYPHPAHFAAGEYPSCPFHVPYHDPSSPPPRFPQSPESAHSESHQSTNPEVLEMKERRHRGEEAFLACKR